MANTQVQFEFTNKNTSPVGYLHEVVKATFDKETGHFTRPDGSIAAVVKYSDFEPDLNSTEWAYFTASRLYDPSLTVEELIRDTLKYRQHGNVFLRENGTVVARARKGEIIPQWTPAELKDLVENERGRGYGGLGSRPTEDKCNMGLVEMLRAV